VRLRGKPTVEEVCIPSKLGPRLQRVRNEVERGVVVPGNIHHCGCPLDSWGTPSEVVQPTVHHNGLVFGELESRVVWGCRVKKLPPHVCLWSNIGVA
jgi:hypothetical protein